MFNSALEEDLKKLEEKYGANILFYEYLIYYSETNLKHFFSNDLAFQFDKLDWFLFDLMCKSILESTYQESILEVLKNYTEKVGSINHDKV